MKDLIIPIVFPDYKITVETPKVKVDVFPWTDFDNFTIPMTKNKIPDLGHAGVLLVNGRSGLTKYYEYGRYDYPEYKGVVQRVVIPDARVDGNGVVLSSLIEPLQVISRHAGDGGRIEAVFIEAEGVFDELDTRILGSLPFCVDFLRHQPAV